MYYLNLDENNYLLSVSETHIDGPCVESLDGLDLSGRRLRAHRWDGEALTPDEERLRELKAESEADENAPTPLKQLRADVDYIAVMTGVSL